jgi:hypothetical protein
MWPSELGAARPGENSGDLASELGREVAGEALGVATDRFVCVHVGERGPAAGHGGNRRQQPQG